MCAFGMKVRNGAIHDKRAVKSGFHTKIFKGFCISLFLIEVYLPTFSSVLSTLWCFLEIDF